MSLRALLLPVILVGTVICSDLYAQRPGTGTGTTTRPTRPSISRPTRPSISRPAPRTARPTRRDVVPSRPTPRTSTPRYRPTPRTVAPSRPTPRTTTPRSNPRSSSTWRRSSNPPSYRDRVPDRSPSTSTSTDRGWRTLLPTAPKSTSPRQPRLKPTPKTNSRWSRSGAKPTDRLTRSPDRSAGTVAPSVQPRSRFIEKLTSPRTKPSSRTPVRPLRKEALGPVGSPKNVVTPELDVGSAPGAASSPTVPVRPAAPVPADVLGGNKNLSAESLTKSTTGQGLVPAPLSTLEGGRDGLSFGLYYTQGLGSAAGFSVFAGNGQLVSPYGASPFGFCYESYPYWSCGYAYNCGYGLPWWSPYHSYGYPWYSWHYGRGLSNYYHSRYRWSFGFGFSYSPSYVGFRYGSSYPYYRRYEYYPYCYYNTVTYYPAYATVYHSDAVVVDYEDASDPYVEFFDTVPAAAPVGPPVPDAFKDSFAAPFPDGLSAPELVARGVGWMKESRYLMAAEAFRLAWLARPSDHLAPIKLSMALLGAGGRYGLAGYAVHEGLGRSPEWPTRRDVDVKEDFAAFPAFDVAVTELKKHVLKNPDDGEGRFLLGYALFFSGDPFAAHKEFQALQDADWKSPHIQTFLDESEKRLLGAPR